MTTGRAIRHPRYGIGQLIHKDLTTGTWSIRFAHGTVAGVTEDTLSRVFAH